MGASHQCRKPHRLNSNQGLYIPRKIIQVFSLHLNCFQRCRLQQGQVYNRAQQSQVQTVTRRNTKSTTQRLSSLSLPVWIQSSLTCLINIVNHKDQTRTKGWYISRKIIQVFSLHLNCFQLCRLQQGFLDNCAQQSQVQTITRINTKSKTQR